MQYVNRYTSSIGNITMASDGEALTGLWFDGQKYFGLYLDNENEEKDQNTGQSLLLAFGSAGNDIYFYV